MFVVLDYVTAEGCEVAGRSCIRSVFAVAVDAQRALRQLRRLVRSLLQLVDICPDSSRPTAGPAFTG